MYSLLKELKIPKKGASTEKKRAHFLSALARFTPLSLPFGHLQHRLSQRKKTFLKWLRSFLFFFLKVTDFPSSTVVTWLLYGRLTLLAITPNTGCMHCHRSYCWYATCKGPVMTSAAWSSCSAYMYFHIHAKGWTDSQSTVVIQLKALWVQLQAVL